jgi:DNA-directed RNA polymerase subunit RPC12/RpoP
MKLKCSKCGYEWESESKLEFVTCPNCLLKFNRNGKKEVKPNDKDDKTDKPQ